MITKGACDNCKRPFLDEENEIVWEVFQLLGSQLKTGGMGGVFGVDFASLQVVLEAKMVPTCEWEWIIERLNIINRVVLHFNEERQEAMKSKK